DVPHALKGKVRPLVAALCARHGLDPSALRFCALHPGGRRILEDLDADLGLAGLTEPSWDVLRRYGNLSSATVLFVLDEVLRRASARRRRRRAATPGCRRARRRDRDRSTNSPAPERG